MSYDTIEHPLKILFIGHLHWNYTFNCQTVSNFELILVILSNVLNEDVVDLVE